MKGLKFRTVAFVGMAVVAIICCYAFSNPPTNPSSGVVVWLPEDIPGCDGERGEMGKAEQKWLPKDTTYLSMTYREWGYPAAVADYRAIRATLIVAGADSRSLHRPQVCLTAQGWTITKREVVTVPTKGGPLDVMDFHLAQHLRKEDGSLVLDENGEKILRRAHYFYWWVGPARSTPSDEKKVWTSVWSSILRGENERWGYPSVLVFVDDRYGLEDGEEEARYRAAEFIRDYAHTFQKSLGAKEREDAVPLKTL
jgi:hypothetical protein